MKFAILTILLGATAVAFAATSAPIDEALAKKAVVVLRAKRLSTGEGSKFLWYEVEVLRVLKNESGESVGKKMQVAAYSFKPGIPEGESTLYLEHYGETKSGHWQLVGGEASTGVSHATK
ncbi:MAG: hypothetical protein QM760_20190 [Nibricoccus sp.]